IEDPRDNWPRVGEVLGELFGDAADPVSVDPVMIATTAAGAIPYYSQLPIVDMLGLNDRWVARHGVVMGSRPGHTRRADFDYLLERRVNLVIGHPRVEPRDGGSIEGASFPLHRLSWFYLVDVDPERIPATARVVEIPLDTQYAVKVLYLVPHPRVEAVIERAGLRHWRISS
ncbi:MAG: hypothetical protein AAF560_25810, partial [Acidobacteriota bacterium]